MKKATYKIQMRDGTEQVIEGDVVNEIYGIDKRKVGDFPIAYYMTHIPSGVLVTNARTKKALMEIANLPQMIDQTDHNKMREAVAGYWNRKGWKD